MPEIDVQRRPAPAVPVWLWVLAALLLIGLIWWGVAGLNDRDDVAQAPGERDRVAGARGDRRRGGSGLYAARGDPRQPGYLLRPGGVGHGPRCRGRPGAGRLDRGGRQADLHGEGRAAGRDPGARSRAARQPPRDRSRSPEAGSAPGALVAKRASPSAWADVPHRSSRLAQATQSESVAHRTTRWRTVSHARHHSLPDTAGSVFRRPIVAQAVPQ
jgi:hypothetical protein